MGCCASETTGAQNERIEAAGKLEKKPKDPKGIGKAKAEAGPADPTAGRKKMYAKNEPIKLGYWKMRGQAQPIRYLLEYTEHPY